MYIFKTPKKKKHQYNATGEKSSRNVNWIHLALNEILSPRGLLDDSIPTNDYIRHQAPLTF